MGLFAKARALYRVKGVSGMAKWLREHLWSRREYVVIRKVVEAIDCPGQFDDIVFREATEQDIPLIVKNWPDDFGFQFRGMGVGDAFRARMVMGEIVTIGVNRGNESELVFTSCLCRHSFTLWTMFGEQVPEGHICSSRIWVSPHHRRKGVAVRGLMFAEAVAAKQGNKCIWALVISWNEASLRLHDKLGYERYERLNYIWRLGMRYVLFEREGRRRRLPFKEPEGLFQ